MKSPFGHPSRSLLKLAVVALLALASTACGGRVDAPAIGFTYNWGDRQFEQFIQGEVQRAAPLGGDTIHVVTSNTGGWPAFGRTALAAEVQRATLISDLDDVVVVVGPGGSREALLVAPVYRAAEMPVLIPTATSRLLREAGDHLFLLAANDSAQGAFIATFADSALGAKRVAIFYAPDEYGIGLAAGTAATMEARGQTLVTRQPLRLTQKCVMAAERAYYDGVAEELGTSGTPDAVVIAARTVEVACFSRALRARWPEIHILAGDGVYLDPIFFEFAGPRAANIHVVAFWHPDLPSPRSQAFRDEWRRVTGTTPRHGEAVFYDAAMLAAAAIRAAGANRTAITNYLRSLGVTRPPYEGVTGPLGFGPDSPRRLLMLRTEGAGSVLVSAQ